jgi:formate dehydrogenase assembly factor FdhD
MATVPDSTDRVQPSKRGGRMSEDAVVEEVPVWLEVNGRPAVTWMCTPDLLEELAIGWLHGEGYIDSLEQVHLRPCATDLGFWAEVPQERVDAVRAEGRKPVLASGCGAVSTPSVPSTLAVEIARRSGMGLVGRAVSGEPQMHGAAGLETKDHR